MTKELTIFNTLTRRKETFRPLAEERVSLYTCGPTVYHYAHIGNLRTYVFEDLLVRTLERAGYQVLHVMNITDVGHLVGDGDQGEDKMEAGSKRTGKSAWEIAEFYTEAFFNDCEKLGVRRPKLIPKATDHIPEMIELIRELEKKGMVYRTVDGMYYDTSKFPHYRDFARLDVENLEAGKRVSVGDKKSPTDFALWKFSPVGEKRQMEWDSPWGKGFPGWHIECSAMAMKYLGQTFDIHCGGIDHIPVHHTNEIAQSEAATGRRFVNYWMHGEFLNEDSGKMSKSKGEFLTLSLVEKHGFHPMDYRFLILQAHYRSPLLFHWDTLKAAQSGLNGILEQLREWRGENEKEAVMNDRMLEYRTNFDDALFDDLNSAKALSVFFTMLRDASLSAAQRKKMVADFDEVLGLKLLERAAEAVEITPAAQALVEARDKARKEKNWAESDRLRTELMGLGYKVEDSPKGTKITKA